MEHEIEGEVLDYYIKEFETYIRLYDCDHYKILIEKDDIPMVIGKLAEICGYHISKKERT